LQCESILYERGHFLKEIAIAADFHSKLPPLDLIAEADFARAHPEVATLSAHQLAIARLQDEQQRREELLAAQKALEASNDTLANANDEMRRRKKVFNETMKKVYTSLRDTEGDYFPPQADLSAPMER
jgi:hypothetical protein